VKTKHKHHWKYFAGEARCVTCGLYLQPDGRVTRTRSGKSKRRPAGGKKKGKGKKS